MRRLVVAALLVTLLAPARPAHADEKPRPRRGLTAAGAVISTVGYLPALALAIHYRQGELALPVLGPLVDLRRCQGCTASAAEQGVVAGLALDAVVQAAGLALLVAGLALHRQPPKVTLLPTGRGLFAVGRF
jgi:hypothetical protein